MEYGTNIVEVTRVFPFQNWQTCRIVLRLNWKITAESVELLNIAGIQYHGRVLGSQWTRLLRDGNKYLQVIEEKELNFLLRPSNRYYYKLIYSVVHRLSSSDSEKLFKEPYECHFFDLASMSSKMDHQTAGDSTDLPDASEETVAAGNSVRPTSQMIYLETYFTTCAC